MRKRILYHFIAILLISAACNQAGTNPANKENKKLSYTCPMDKTISGDKPGKCTECGMELIQKSNKPNNN